MLKEDIIHLSPHIRINHVPGIVLDSTTNTITWTSRILSNDFSREFTKYNIHINSDCNIVPFDTFWKQKYPHHLVETYYIERVYQL